MDIRQDGLSLFSSTANINSDGVLTTTGTALTGASQSGSDYGWRNTSLSVFLGALAPGSSTSVTVDLMGHAVAEYGAREKIECDHDGRCIRTIWTGYSIAQIGDPGSISDRPISGIGITGTPVPAPEPATLGLMGIGAAVLAFARRRHTGNR